MEENEEQLEESQQDKIDLKQAVQIAIDAVKDLYSIQGHQLPDLLLEEVGRSGGYWKITLGFTRPGSGFGALTSPQQRRAFKEVRIDQDTGELKDMHIRTLPTPQQ